jgi:hypothetical protein
MSENKFLKAQEKLDNIAKKSDAISNKLFKIGFGLTFLFTFPIVGLLIFGILGGIIGGLLGLVLFAGIISK